MRSNLVAGGMVACGAACLALAAVPALGIPAAAACAIGGGLSVGGLFLWKPKDKGAAMTPTPIKEGF